MLNARDLFKYALPAAVRHIEPPVRVPYEFQVVDTYPLQASVSSLAFSYKIGDTAPETIAIRVLPAGFAPGTYTTNFQLAYSGKTDPEITIPITLTFSN